MALVVLSMFLVAGIAVPTALASEDDEKRESQGRSGEARERGADERREAREASEHAKEERREAKAASEQARRDARFERDLERLREKGGENITLNLTGTGTAKDGTNYTIELSGAGVATTKVNDENLTRTRGLARMHYRLVDANGTVLAEGNLTGKVQVREKDDGNWTWHFEAVKKKGKNDAKLNLRGPATPAGAEGDYSLEGKGKLTVKKMGEKRAKSLKLVVAGSFDTTA